MIDNREASSEPPQLSTILSEIYSVLIIPPFFRLITLLYSVRVLL